MLTIDELESSTAAELFHPANNFNSEAWGGSDIWEAIFGGCDRALSTDDRAVFADGSALVYRGGAWFVETPDLEDQIKIANS